MKKRLDYLTWDQYFMCVAKVCALRSKDPNTQVGACIINSDTQIIATGYNGLPRSLSDDEYPWNREGKFLQTKYAYVVHAEINAILSATTNLKNSVLYVSLFPCHECVKAIIQVGIKEIIYFQDVSNTESDLVAKRMLNDAKIKWRKLNVENINISITL